MPKELKIIEETDGDFYSIDSKGYHQIVLFPSNGCRERGIYFYETKQGYTHASRHENLKDILSTTTHENIHQAIDLCHEWEIEDEDEKERLKKLIQKINPSGGVIVRTASEGASEEALRSDIEYLDRLGKEIQKNYEKKKTA